MSQKLERLLSTKKVATYRGIYEFEKKNGEEVTEEIPNSQGPVGRGGLAEIELAKKIGGCP